jgi:hypothetical protein
MNAFVNKDVYLYLSIFKIWHTNSYSFYTRILNSYAWMCTCSVLIIISHVYMYIYNLLTFIPRVHSNMSKHVCMHKIYNTEITIHVWDIFKQIWSYCMILWLDTYSNSGFLAWGPTVTVHSAIMKGLCCSLNVCFTKAAVLLFSSSEVGC